MAIFHCSKCGCDDDTALCNYWLLTFRNSLSYARFVILKSENGTASSREGTKRQTR
jgi:hypothetical protein